MGSLGLAISQKASTSIHVLHLLNAFVLGGAEIGVLRLARKLSVPPMRHTICLLRGLKNARALVPHPVQVVGLDIRGRNPMAFWPLGRLLRRERVDIVHVNNLAPWPDAYVASRMARCACIETFHGVEQATFSVPGWKKALYRFLVRKSERVTAVAESSKELFVRISGADPSWIQVVENGIDTEQFAPCRTPKDRASLRQRLGLPLEAFVFVSVAGLRPVKDPMGLIRAYRRAFAFSDSAATVLVLVGRGTDGRGRARLTCRLWAMKHRSWSWGPGMMCPRFSRRPTLSFSTRKRRD